MRTLAIAVATLGILANACATADRGDDPFDDDEEKPDARRKPDADPMQPDAAPLVDATPGAPAASDGCAGAADLTLAALGAGGVTTSGSTTGYANDTQPPITCTGYTPDGPDAIYKVTASAGQTITATVTPMGWDASVFISSNCQMDAMCLAGADAAGTDGAETASITVGNGSATYYVVVESWDPEDHGPYSLNVLLLQ